MANISTILSNSQVVHLRGYLSGLVLSTAGASATFSVAAGVAVDDVQKDFMNLAASISKTTSAWAVGSGNGGIDTGAIAINTGYHVYLIKRPDTGVVDVLFSLSVSAPTMPANYTLKRRIGWIKSNASSQWIKFVQLGDLFMWDVPIVDLNNSTLSTTSILIPLSVPSGLSVEAIFWCYWQTTPTGALLTMSSPLIATPAANAPAGNLTSITQLASGGIVSQVTLATDTSNQVRAVAAAANAGTNFIITTTSWRDTRGKL